MLTVLVVYESMFGATRKVAEAIAEGASQTTTVQLRRADQVQPEELAAADVLVVGAPTHAHALSRPQTRRTAEEWGRDPDKGLRFEAEPGAIGVRELLRSLPPTRALTAAFDTRMDAPEPFTGSAARGIAKRLGRKGLHAAEVPQSFIVNRTGALMEGELDHAWHFGHSIAAAARDLREPVSA